MSNQLEEHGDRPEESPLPTDEGRAEAPGARRASKTAGAARSKSSPSKKAAAKAPETKTKRGARGGSPWAARHAAKHAAEAKARAESPLQPGSARATVRIPSGAEALKEKVANLHSALERVRSLRKDFAKNFYDIGEVLAEVLAAKLYEAKGFGSFEAFLEREIDLGKLRAQQLVRIAAVFQRGPAVEYGFDRCLAALGLLDAPPDASPSPPLVAPSSPRLPLPLKPPASRVG